MSCFTKYPGTFFSFLSMTNFWHVLPVPSFQPSSLASFTLPVCFASSAYTGNRFIFVQCCRLSCNFYFTQRRSSFAPAVLPQSIPVRCMHPQAMNHSFQPSKSIFQLFIVLIFCFQCPLFTTTFFSCTTFQICRFQPAVFTADGKLFLSPNLGSGDSFPAGSFSQNSARNSSNNTSYTSSSNTSNTPPY